MTSLNSSLNIWRLLLLLRILNVNTESGSKEPPCDYWDTVALEEKFKFPNGSYAYKDVIVPANETWTYDYRMPVRNVKINAPPHVRGCICKFRKCISICCIRGDEFVGNECTNTIFKIVPSMDVTTEQGKTYSANISTQFINQYGRPCGKLLCFKNNYNFTLFENGSISYEDDGTHILSKNEYCLSPSMTNNIFRYYPWACDLTKKSDTAKKGIVMITSVPFMLFTILAYQIYLHSNKDNPVIKSTCFYLLALSLAFTTLGYITLVRNIEQTFCSILGYTTYFAFIASYSWLAVISADLYWNVNRIQGEGSKCKTLMFYSLFGWGFPTFLLGFALFAQHQDWDDNYKPNIGGKIYCFFDRKGYNMLIYFYGPTIVLISFNVVMFLLSIARLIKHHAKPIRNALQSNTGFRQKLLGYLMRFQVYSRVFLITGVAWVFEILAYFFPGSPVFEALFYLVAFQGYFIFILVVFHADIRKALKKRFNELFYGEESGTLTTQNTIHTQQSEL